MHPGSSMYLCKGEHSSWEKKLKSKKQTHWRKDYKAKCDYGFRDLWEKVHTKYKRQTEKKKKTESTPLNSRNTEELETIKLNACGFELHIFKWLMMNSTGEQMSLRVLSDIQRWGNRAYLSTLYKEWC